jgi:hypothetical protein
MAAATKLGVAQQSEPLSARLFERHFSPAEIAELWGLSVDCIRGIFENEPGVLVIGNTQPRRYDRFA